MPASCPPPRSLCQPACLVSLRWASLQALAAAAHLPCTLSAVRQPVLRPQQHSMGYRCQPASLRPAMPLRSSVCSQLRLELGAHR